LDSAKTVNSPSVELRAAQSELGDGNS